MEFLREGRRESIGSGEGLFDRGVNIQDDHRIKRKVVPACVIQSADRIEESTEKIKWKTIVEVANVFPGEFD